MKQTRIYYSLFFILVIMFFLMLVIGCSESESVATDPYPEMSRELRNLQGTWVPATTNCCDTSTAIFTGYTIRIRYKQNAESPLLKHNVSIERVDAARQLLVLNGGTKAWPFYHRSEDGTELLDIEFFSQTGWQSAFLKRDQDQQIAAQ